MTNQAPALGSNSNELKPEAPSELTILSSAYESMNLEFTRIRRLLALKSDATPNSRLGEYMDKLGQNFSEQVNMIDSKLILLRGVTNPRRKTKPTPEDIRRAWEAYEALRTDLIPNLSKDLLALLGGVYLMQLKLDVIEPDHVQNADGIEPDQKQGPELQSFSQLAEVMLKELTHQYPPSPSKEEVLIVGEEDWSHSVSEIVRLRFPACEIWHLPFTAQEYFYLAAQKDSRAPTRFTQLRNSIVENVDPSRPDWEVTNRECYLPEVRKLWKEYEAIKGLEDQKAAYYKDKKERIEELKVLQRAYVCRLFADAFATYYVGPAYLHALLNLSFISDPAYNPLQYLPPINVRFVIAMEILNWMNDELTYNVDSDDKEFKRELFYNSANPSGLRHLWNLALQSKGKAEGTPDPYDSINDIYTDWIEKIKDVLNDYSLAWKATYDNWTQAKAIETKLLQNDLELNFEPNHWAVVNAAWSARWLYPSSGGMIRNNALILLNLHDKNKTWLKISPSKAAKEGQTKPVAGDGFDKDAAIAKITQYLGQSVAISGDALPLIQFSTMVASKKFEDNKTITNALPPYMSDIFYKLIGK
jgi:hypothetical protein